MPDWIESSEVRVIQKESCCSPTICYPYLSLHSTQHLLFIDPIRIIDPIVMKSVVLNSDTISVRFNYNYRLFSYLIFQNDRIFIFVLKKKAYAEIETYLCVL